MIWCFTAPNFNSPCIQRRAYIGTPPQCTLHSSPIYNKVLKEDEPLTTNESAFYDFYHNGSNQLKVGPTHENTLDLSLRKFQQTRTHACRRLKSLSKSSFLSSAFLSTSSLLSSFAFLLLFLLHLLRPRGNRPRQREESLWRRLNIPIWLHQMAPAVASAAKQAELLRKDGNKCFERNRFGAAIDNYTEV